MSYVIGNSGLWFFNELSEDAWKRAYESICEISKEAEKEGVIISVGTVIPYWK